MRQSFVLIFIIVLSVQSMASRELLVSKNKWLRLYSKNLISGICLDSVKINKCFGKTFYNCKLDVKNNLKVCLKEAKIKTRVRTGRESKKLGHKLGLCVGVKLSQSWKVSQKSECQL